VYASPTAEVSTARSAGFVVTNATSSRKGSQAWPGRTNGFKLRVGAFPASDSFALVWPDAEPDDATLGRLVRLARRVPYLGRSTSSVELSVLPEAVAIRPSWTRYRPTTLHNPRGLHLRIPYAGYVDELRAAYDRGQRPWDVSRSIAYAVDEPLTTEPVVQARPQAGPYRELLVWGIKRPSVPLAGDTVLTVTSLLRKAVVARVGRLGDVPALVSGHDADGLPHVAYLGLLDVGHEHSDGHLLGVGVAVPEQLQGEDRRRVLRALIGVNDPLSELQLLWGRAVELTYQPDRTKPWGLVPERWTGGRYGSRRWFTVTPIMLDRYPGRRDDIAAMVSQAVVTAGYPEPAAVEVLPGPPVRGGVHRPRRGTIPDGRPRRPLVQCRLEWTQPLIGPVIAGSLRYLGFGLLVPERPEEDEDDVGTE